MQKLKFLSEYLLLRFIVMVFCMLPWKLALNLGAFLSRFAIAFSPKRFKLSKDNIKIAFPEKSEEEIRKIAVESWKNLGMTIAETAKSSIMSKKSILKHCTLKTNPHVDEYVRQKKGALIHTGHLGNWEMVNHVSQISGINTSVITRRVKNPYVDKWIKEVRVKFGGTVISHKSPFFSCVRNLKRGRFIGILMDQNTPKGEIFVPFFGKMAATTPLTALLALKTKSPIVPLRIVRKDYKIIAEFEEPIIPTEDYSEEAVKNLVMKLNAKLEEWIKAEPHLWLWAHNRWKRTNDYKQKK
jgi:Kdo2-lipid IVA lauroyltransferase/acyltransferase